MLQKVQLTPVLRAGAVVVVVVVVVVLSALVHQPSSTVSASFISLDESIHSARRNSADRFQHSWGPHEALGGAWLMHLSIMIPVLLMTFPGPSSFLPLALLWKGRGR